MWNRSLVLSLSLFLCLIFLVEPIRPQPNPNPRVLQASTVTKEKRDICTISSQATHNRKQTNKQTKKIPISSKQKDREKQRSTRKGYSISPSIFPNSLSFFSLSSLELHLALPSHSLSFSSILFSRGVSFLFPHTNPASFNDFLIMISLTALKTALILFVSVAQVMCV